MSVLPAIDAGAVAVRVGHLFNDVDVRLEAWRAEPLDVRSYSPSTVTLWRVAGIANTRGRSRPWSILAKDLKRPDVGGSEGWDREVYANEMLAGLPASPLRTPRYLGTDRWTGDVARLWLEYVEATPGYAWTLPDWRRFAGTLASFQTAHVDASCLGAAWLNHDDLRKWVETDRASLFPLPARSLPAALDQEAVSAVWEGRSAALARLDQFPGTLCHNDVWSGNVGLQDRHHILFDWQLVGPGPVAGDLPFAVAAGVWLLLIPAANLVPMETALINGYQAGLEGFGARHLSPVVAEAFALTAALRYTLMAPQYLRGPGEFTPPTLAARAAVVSSGLRWARVAGLL